MLIDIVCVSHLYDHAKSTAHMYVTVELYDYTVSTELPHHEIRSQVKRDYPLNLSILIRGGKENNHDTLSNGE